MTAGLSILVHGGSKIGKSRFGATSPAPRLILDAEAGSRFVPGTKIYWDPLREQPPRPPDAQNPWDTCIVTVREFSTVTRAFDWLLSGMHPFQSVVLDSVSEIQQRCVDSLVGVDPMKQQDWGTLLRQVSALIRQFRDLTVHPTHPLWAVVFIAMTGERGADAKWRPLVQGALRDVLPYYVDVCGYMFMGVAADGQPARSLLVSPHPQYEAGERVNGVLGTIITNPNVTEMLRVVLAAEQQGAAHAGS